MKRRRSHPWISLLMALVSVLFVGGLSLLLATAFSHVQPEPYMDEIFHVRQTRSYLNGSWTEWDSKITTPPGTYFLFWATYQMSEKVGFVSGPPSMFNFRYFNVLISVLNHILLLFISRRLESCETPTMTALSIITNPVLFFFSTLYYTDQCALLFLLLMVYASVTGLGVLSAILGVYGVFVRQTNVVWLLISLCLLVGRNIASVYMIENQEYAALPASTWFHRVLTKSSRQPLLPLYAAYRALVHAPFHFAVVLGFLVFVYWNGGIVLGDRTAHTAVFHVCQLWYFVVFCSLHTPTETFRFLQRCIHRWRRSSYTIQFRRFVLYLSLLMLILASLHYTSIIHPYLLADNRHYTFYIWRKIIARSPLTFYSLAVLYLYCTVYWLDSLFGPALTFTHWLLNLSIILGTVIVLVPAGLLEPRYFLLPYILWRLFAVRFRTEQSNLRFLELGANLCVTGITSYLFYAKPFFWTHESGVQRFIW